MKANEYQKMEMRTNDGKATDRMISGVLTCDLKWLHNQNVVREDTEGLDLGGVLNGCLGLAGESGEVLDMVKKWVFHEKKMDKYHLKKEIGDVMWYVAMLCESFGFDLDEILQMNVDKLKARYPEGFDTVRANNRAECDVQMEDAIRIIEGLDTSNSEENIEAKKMAVAAMRKQIHRKVIKKECEGEKITKCLCPTCEEVLRIQWDDGFIIGCKKTYCDKCGQRLDWSDYYDKRR